MLALPSAHERCHGCGDWVRRGQLAVYARDHYDLRNGKARLCQPCTVPWKAAHEAVMTGLAALAADVARLATRALTR